MADGIQDQAAPAPVAAVVEKSPPLEVADASEPVATEVANSSDQTLADSTTTNEPTTNAAVDSNTENHSAEPTENQENSEAKVEMKGEEAPAAEKDNEKEESTGDADGDIEMSDHNEYSDDGSEYEPEAETPPPPTRTPKNNKTKSPPSVKKTPAAGSATAPTSANVTPTSGAGASGSQDPQTPQNTRPPKTPISRVRSGRVEKSSTPGSNLRCPVKGCGQTFTGRNPRQSLWHHLKYYATRGLPDRQEFEKAHGDAHAEMKREAEPKGTPVERNRISSSDYRKKNPEKAKTSARLSNFRARARKKGINDEREIEEHVLKWEKEWQEKQAKEASEYFSGILLSAFE